MRACGLRSCVAALLIAAAALPVSAQEIRPAEGELALGEASERRVSIPGTRLQLTPPEGFELARDFAGLVHDFVGTTVVASELAVPESAASAWLEHEALAARGMRRVHVEDLRLEGGEATLVHATEDAEPHELYRWLLVHGDERSTALLVVTTLASHESRLRADVMSLLASLRRDPGTRVDAFDGLAFRVDPTADLVFRARTDDRLVLIRRDQIGPLRGRDPRALVTRHELVNEIEDLDRHAREHLEESEQTAAIVEVSGARVRMGGLDAWEIQARGKGFEALGDLFVYQVFAVDRTHAYVIQGYAASEERSHYLKQFRALVRSFRRAR